MKFVALNEAPTTLLTLLFRVERKSSVLEGGKVTPDRPDVATFLFGQISDGDAVFVGLKGP